MSQPTINQWLDRVIVQQQECFAERILKFDAKEEVTELTDDPDGGEPRELVEFTISIIAFRY